MEENRRIVYVTVSENGNKVAMKFYSAEIKLVSKTGDLHAVIQLKSNNKEYHCRENHNEVLRQMNGGIKTV